MLSCYLEQQAAVFATLTTKEVKKNVKELVTLSDEDVANAEDVIQVLKPLKTLTTMLCSEQMPTVSMILPLKEMILKSMTAVESDSQLVKSVKSAIFNDISPDILTLTLKFSSS